MSRGDPAAGARQPALELLAVSKSFGQVRALDDVSMSVDAGTVHALLGENGAGKSTLMRIAHGLLAADGGVVRLFGQVARSASVRDPARVGVGMVHQQLSLVPTLTAAENLGLAAGSAGRFRPELAARELRQLSETSGLRVPAEAFVRDLSIVEQQRLEILKALWRGAKLLILDEPTSGLAPREVDDLLRWIRSYADRGGTVVLVTHKLREALAVANAVTVLRRGRVAHQGTAAGATEAELARAIFPDAPEIPAGARPRATPAVASGATVVVAQELRVEDAAGATRIAGATLRVQRGEVVGIAAVEGSGHRELLEALAGLRAPGGGSLHLPSRIALIPASRLRDALIGDFTLVENVALHGAGTRPGTMPWREITERTSALLRRFDVVASGPAAPARALSGGNQQRLVIARELEHEVDLVIADDPTRGLDLKGAQFVHDQLRDAGRRGAGIVVHSSDLDELLALADRMYVVFHGVVTEAPVQREAVGRAMLGMVA